MKLHWGCRWAIIGLLLSSCASVGQRFPTDRVLDLEPSTTTQGDVIAMFGQPWRTGYDDGFVAWTYARYGWSLFGGSTATDLVTRFDDRGILVSYSFSTTEDDRSRR
jgi:hypothetical protein